MGAGHIALAPFSFLGNYMDQDKQTIKMNAIYEIVGELYVQGKLMQEQLTNTNIELARLKNFLNSKNTGIPMGSIPISGLPIGNPAGNPIGDTKDEQPRSPSV